MKTLVSVLLAIFMLATIGCNAAEPPKPPKFGVVDILKVINTSKLGQKANAEVDALVKAKQTELKEKGDAIKKLERGLKEQPPKGKADDLNRAVAEYRKLATLADDEVKKKAGELRKTVFEQIKKIIEAIGQEEKFEMIFTSDNVPYYQAATDITDKVIKRYDDPAGSK